MTRPTTIPRLNRHIPPDETEMASHQLLHESSKSRRAFAARTAIIQVSPCEKLPQELKTMVLRFAADSWREQPRRGDTMAGATSSWLLGVACVSRGWFGAAIDVLYEDPDLYTLERCSQFYEFLEDPPASRFNNNINGHEHIEYNRKVFKLEFDGRELSRKSKTVVFELEDLLTQLADSTLKQLIIYDSKDSPMLRQIAVQATKWTYPEGVFAALNSRNQRLKRWDWNGHWLPKFGKNDILERYQWLRAKNMTECLKHVTSLELSNMDRAKATYEIPVLLATLEIGQPRTLNVPAEEELLKSLNELQNLKTLLFKSCSVVHDMVISSLQQSLQVLELDNCNEFTSDGFSKFLSARGTELKQLVLTHNKSLNLEFFADLRKHCPKLEMLVVDCLYYNTFSTSRDSNPNYEYLLEQKQEPDWPSTLRLLELRNLRQWLPATAQMFFMSLVKAAPLLTCLQTLIIHAKVDENWRERSRLRTVMADIIRRMFKRKSAPPSAHLRSFNAFNKWKSAQLKGKDESDSDRPLVSAVRKRRSKRGLPDHQDDSDAPLVRPSRRSKRQGRNAANDQRKRRRVSEGRDGASSSKSRPKTRGSRSGAGDNTISTRTRNTRAIARRDPERDDESDASIRALRPRRRQEDAPVPIAEENDSTKPNPKSVLDSEMDELLTNLKRGLVPVQGLCDVCDISIDNQRPMDTQYTENDFLDSQPEDESDEDFDGGDVIAGSGSESGEEWEEAMSESEAEFTDED